MYACAYLCVYMYVCMYVCMYVYGDLNIALWQLISRYIYFFYQQAYFLWYSRMVYIVYVS